MLYGKTILAGTVVSIMMMSATAPGVHADEFTDSVRDIIDDLEHTYNKYLADMFFDKTYATFEIASMETVQSAIDLYEQEKGAQLTVAEDEMRLRHALGYGGDEAVFSVINSMETHESVYPFILDVNTLEILAEGAFPVLVGAPALFLHDADMPLEDIMSDLAESEGVWVRYVFNNPEKDIYETKVAYLSLHDGYIFGSGYYLSMDDVAADNVQNMIRAYQESGGGATFATIDDYEYLSTTPFVLDADTYEVVAHTDAKQVGTSLYDAVDSYWSVRLVSDMLDTHGSMYVTYDADSASGSDYTRAWFQLYDGYIFASGYGVGAEENAKLVLIDFINIYEAGGTDSFVALNDMASTDLHLEIFDLNTLNVAVDTQRPDFVGEPSFFAFDEQTKLRILGFLEQNPIRQVSTFTLDAATGAEMREKSFATVYGDYYVQSVYTYLPEETIKEEVRLAVDLYKMYGDEAFHRINLQSAQQNIIYPFVIDADTWETVAHATVPQRVGVCCSAAIAAYNDPDTVREYLEENDGMWVNYEFYNPISERDELKRAYLYTYDGYTFGSGYYYETLVSPVQVVADTIALYDAKKEVAFDDVNAMMTDAPDYPFVIEHDTMDIVAHANSPSWVGVNFADKMLDPTHSVDEIKAAFRNDGDTFFVVYDTVGTADGRGIDRAVWMQLHDGYIFASGIYITYQFQ